LDVAFGDRRATAPKFNELVGTATMWLLSSPSSPPSSSVPDVRFPQLPCVKAGLDQTLQLLRTLLFGMAADPAALLIQTKDAWEHFPEGLLPLIAASVASSHRPIDHDKLRSFLTAQAELYQMAANSTSILPKSRRIGRYLAVQTSFELTQAFPEAAPQSRADCIKGIRESLASNETSVNECKQYLPIAIQLHDTDLAREILFQWQQRGPIDSADFLHHQVQLELETGSFTKVLSLLRECLNENPADLWAVDQRHKVMMALQKLARENVVEEVPAH
jgi:hypothetical protein